MSCKWAGRGEPRILGGRHREECGSEATGSPETAQECSGCLPCPEMHCVVCSRTHALVTCPECIATARDDLAAIRLMCGALPAEVAHRGVNGEAMMLLGASADPEGWQHVQASYLAGRLPEGWFEAAHGKDCPTLRNDPCVGCAGDELHPLAVLGTWEMVWRDFLEHESDARITVPDAAGYLDRQLAYMADQGDVPFEDFARDLRRCRGHLEDVLHDGDQVETGAPCPGCREREPDRAPPALELEHDDTDTTGSSDKWRCARCKSWWSEADYRLRVGSDHIEHADELTASDMVIRTRVPAGTLRRWAARTTKRIGGETVEIPPRLKPCGLSHDGRKIYRVNDVLALRDGDQREVA